MEKPIYRNNLKNREYAKEAPRFYSKRPHAEAAKLKKFSDAGGRKIDGCPTPAETDSSSCFGIKTIFFDLGNVLIFVDFPKLLKGLSSLLGLSEDQVRQLFETLDLRKKYETGAITTEGLYRLLKKNASKPFSLKEFEFIYSNIFTPNEEIWPLINELKKNKVRLVLLSNTSKCHFDYAKANYPILKVFDDYVLSYEVGFWKPDREIFEAALKTSQCSPEECFYIDDISEFVLSAKKLGIRGAVFKDVASLKRALYL